MNPLDNYLNAILEAEELELIIQETEEKFFEAFFNDEEEKQEKFFKNLEEAKKIKKKYLSNSTE